MDMQAGGPRMPAAATDKNISMSSLVKWIIIDHLKEYEKEKLLGHSNVQMKSVTRSFVTVVSNYIFSKHLNKIKG
jgi:hypothetical protein